MVCVCMDSSMLVCGCACVSLEGIVCARVCMCMGRGRHKHVCDMVGCVHGSVNTDACVLAHANAFRIQLCWCIKHGRECARNDHSRVLLWGPPCAAYCDDSTNVCYNPVPEVNCAHSVREPMGTCFAYIRKSPCGH